MESMGTFRKITLGEYRALREKGVPCAIPTMCVLTIKKDENLLPLCVKSRIVVLGITRTGFGVKAITLPWFFVVTLFVSLSASRWRNVVLFDRAIVRMPFVMVYSLPRRLLLFALHLGILNQIRRNTSSCLKYSMASVAVQSTCTTKSMLFLSLLVLPLLWKTLAFTQDL